MELKELFKDIEKYLEKEVKLEGWIRNHRKQKEFGFIDFYDGTTFQSIQIVYESKLSNFDEISKLRVGCSIEVRGTLAKSQGNGQNYEILASDCTNGEEAYVMVNKYIEEYITKLLKENNITDDKTIDSFNEFVFENFDNFGNLTQEKALKLVSNLVENLLIIKEYEIQFDKEMFGE